MKNLAMFVSGRGGFFRFLVDNRHLLPNINFSCVITDKNLPELSHTADKAGIPVRYVEYKNRPRSSVDQEIKKILDSFQVDIAMLNYNKLLGAEIINAYPHIYNLHLSLLPLHKGFGAIEAAHAENNLFFGATIHEVDNSIDGGNVISQVAIPKTANMTVDEMGAKIFKHGCIMQLDTLAKLTRNPDTINANQAEYLNGALFCPPLSIDVTKMTSP